MICGLEVEFHVFKIVDEQSETVGRRPARQSARVELLTTGYQYLTEHRYDQIDPVVALLREKLSKLKLPLQHLRGRVRSEPVRDHLVAAAGARRRRRDDAASQRGKQVARRHGYHATFMCRPNLPNVMSSGWHLHQSLTRGGKNAFVPESEKEVLSRIPGRRRFFRRA